MDQWYVLSIIYVLYVEEGLEINSYSVNHSVFIHSSCSVQISSSSSGPLWSWSYGSWIYKYVCNQCLSPLKLWVCIPLRHGKVNSIQYYQCLVAGLWFSPDTPVSSTNKIDCHDITEILLNVELGTITLSLLLLYCSFLLTRSTWSIHYF